MAREGSIDPARDAFKLGAFQILTALNFWMRVSDRIEVSYFCPLAGAPMRCNLEMISKIFELRSLRRRLIALPRN